MTAVAIQLASELRSRWRGWVGLVLVVGCFAGVVLAAAAGARRTDTAYPRLLEETGASDYLIAAANSGQADDFYEEVERLPQVASAGVIAGMPLLPDPNGPLAGLDEIVANAGEDTRYGSTIDRPKLLAGRLPDPARPDEALANREMASALHLSVGSELQLLAPTAQYSDPSRTEPVRFTVVGIGLFSREVVPGSLLDAQPKLLLTPAYFAAHADDELNYDGVAVRLAAGTDPGVFRREVERLGEVHGEEVGELFVADDATFQAKTQRAIRPQALALALFAGLAGAAALLVVGQALSRRLSRQADEYPALWALGMTRGQLVSLHLSQAAGVGLLGGAVAAVVAVAASPFMPIGPARLAEPHPGLTVDATVLGVGVVATVVLLVAWTALPGWRAASAPAGAAATTWPGAGGPSRLAQRAAAMGLPVSTTTGIRMALEPGRGRTSVPVRSALVGTAVAIAAVAAAVTFGDNLQRLVTTPSLYGRNWDLDLDTGFGTVALDEVAPLLAGDPLVTGYSGGRYGDITVDGRPVPAVGIDLLRGDVFPRLLEGRPPRGPGEIVLGSTSLRRRGRRVGDSVRVEVAGEASTMSVVGRAVFPKLGRGSFPPTGLGQGAAVIADLLPLFDGPGTPGVGEGGRTPEVPAYSFVLVRFADAADQEARAAVVERFYDRLCAFAPSDCFLITDEDQRPADVSNYQRVASTPMVLAGLLVAMAAAALAHTLVTWVGRRRRDLAVLRTVGFVRNQIRTCVAWQATTLAALAALVGLPLGVAVGRWAWLVLARELGVGDEVAVPVLPVLLALPVAIVTANLVAALPAWLAARVRPAVALRTE